MTNCEAKSELDNHVSNSKLIRVHGDYVKRAALIVFEPLPVLMRDGRIKERLQRMQRKEIRIREYGKRAWQVDLCRGRDNFYRKN